MKKYRAWLMNLYPPRLNAAVASAAFAAGLRVLAPVVADGAPHKSTAAEAAAESFNAIHSRAHHIGETREGKAYDKQFRTAIGASTRDALEACTKHTKPPYIVNLVFTIGSDGSVRRITPAPQQPVSRCVAQQLTALRVPAPPKDDWLVEINIAIEE